VGDLDAAKRELEAKGVQFPAGIRDTDQLRIANFTDPDGTRLNITQMKRRG
jgi:predicted enzyme related to lactoylglutathione lyase